MPVDRPILLVGSIPLSDSEAVFRALGEKLGSHARRYPDGETGARINWIRWQRHIFESNDAFEIYTPASDLAKIGDNLDRRFYRIKSGIDPKTIRYPALGFAEEALRSYAIFSRLKKSGIIPAGTRFQVSVPTVLAILSGFVIVEDRAAAEPALERAMAAEMTAIGQSIPASELTIQWDVCLELIGYDGGYKLHLTDILPEAIERVARQTAMVPPGAEVGIHLCYGDPGHKHVIEPPDATSMVTFANAIFASSPRPIAYMHIPILRQWDEARYYSPLKQLKTPPGTEIYLGLVHFSDGTDGAEKRISAASQFIDDFGIATECGFGRRDPSTIAPLFDLHRSIASA
jgi:hypothetical protein